jgi:Na+/proline symporter
MSTLSGSLNASAAATVGDLLRLPETTPPARQLLVSRALTAAWGAAQIAVALLAIGLRSDVLSTVLAIASFVSGILLGVFALGVFTRTTGPRGALAGMAAGLAVVSAVKLFSPLAWPWFALVGAGTVFAVGWTAGRLLDRPPPGAIAS